MAATGQAELHLSAKIFDDLAELKRLVGAIKGTSDHFIIHAHGVIDLDEETGTIRRRIGLSVGKQTYNWGSDALRQLWRAFRGKCATLALRVCGVSQQTAASIKKEAQAEAVYYDPGINVMQLGVGQFGLDPVYEDGSLTPARYEYDPTSTGPLIRE